MGIEAIQHAWFCRGPPKEGEVPGSYLRGFNSYATLCSCHPRITSTARSLVLCPGGATKFYSYARVQLMDTKRTHEWKTKSRQGGTTRGNSTMDLVWDENFQFSYDSDDLAFIR